MPHDPKISFLYFFAGLQCGGFWIRSKQSGYSAYLFLQPPKRAGRSFFHNARSSLSSCLHFEFYRIASANLRPMANHEEIHEKPPFFKHWKSFYWLLVIWLVVQIIVYYIITKSV
jgi:hypothetical protein